MKLINAILNLATFVIKHIQKQFLRLINTYKEHKFLYIVLLAIFLFFFAILVRLVKDNLHLPFISVTSEVNSNNGIISQSIYIKGFSLPNLSYLISFLLMPIGGMWALHQYSKTIKFNQQSKGAEIAKKFADKKIEEIGIIDLVFNNFRHKDDYIKKISKYQRVNFNNYEMNKIFSRNEIDEYMRFISRPKTNEIYINILKKKHLENKYPKTFFTFIVETLNDLEAICIDISSSAAGSEFIYPSLHSSFNKLVQLLYIKISNSNIDNIDFSFINIKYVYNSWQNLKRKDHKKLVHTQNKIDKINKKADEEVQKLLDKKPETI